MIGGEGVAVSRKQKKLLAAGGWLLLCLILAWAAIDHATCDLSRLDPPGPVIGRWARLKKMIYDAAGRPGLVILDLGFLTAGVYAFASSLKQAGIGQGPADRAADAVRDKALASTGSRTCACCNALVSGRPEELPDGAPLKTAVAYLCRSCGAFVCADCAEKRIPWSRWDGWSRSRCPVCGGRFAPDAALVRY